MKLPEAVDIIFAQLRAEGLADLTDRDKRVGVVAVEHEGLLINSPEQIAQLLCHRRPFKEFSKHTADFMAVADLGPQWVALGESPVLFAFNDGVLKMSDTMLRAIAEYRILQFHPHA